MERNQPQPPTAKSFGSDAEWQNFASKARTIYDSFVILVKKPIKESVPDVVFSVDDNDMALYLDLQHFNVLVYGVLKSGKSMLLKALIDLRLPLPSDASPCTSALCTVKYGAKKRVCFIRRSNKEKIEVDLENFKGTNSKTPHEEMMEYMSRTMSQTVTDRDRESEWESIEIYWPSEILRQGYTFIDAPGLGENEVNDALVTKALREAHLLLVALGSPITKENKGQIERLREQKDMFFVVTKFDTVMEQPWVSAANKLAARKEARDRYLLNMKTSLGEVLPDFQEKIADRNFHAVSAQAVVDDTRSEDVEWIERFENLKKNIYTDIRVRAANAALRRLETLIEDALEWSSRGKDNLEKKKEDQETEQTTLSTQLNEIKEEHVRVKEAFVELVNSAKDEIMTFVTSLLDETGRKNSFGFEAKRLIAKFHESHCLATSWKNTAEQRKRYQDQMRGTVPRQFEEYIEKFWKSQQVPIQEICEKHINKCKQIMAKLIQMLKDLDKSMEQILPVEGNSLLKTLANLDKIALPDAPSVIGSLAKIVIATVVPSAFFGSVVAYIGVAAMGPATLLLAVPFGAIFAYKFIKSHYDDNDYDKGTEQMRQKMEQALESFIVENADHWVKSYCKAGSDILDHVIATTSVKIGEEIEVREKKVKEILELIGRLGDQGKILDTVLPDIVRLKRKVEELKNSNFFEEKTAQEKEIPSLVGSDTVNLGFVSLQ